MKRTILIVAGGLVLVVLLAGAAFVAGQMWGKEAPQDEAQAEPQPVVLPEGAPKDDVMVMKLEPAEELPQRSPNAVGVFTRREDNRIFVAANSQGQAMIIIQDGETAGDANTNEVEIVVSSETVIYEDVTQQELGGSSPGGSVRQKVKPGSVEEIGEYSIVSAWGEKRGERLVAEYLVYTGPLVISR